MKRTLKLLAAGLVSLTVCAAATADTHYNPRPAPRPAPAARPVPRPAPRLAPRPRSVTPMPHPPIAPRPPVVQRPQPVRPVTPRPPVTARPTPMPVGPFRPNPGPRVIPVTPRPPARPASPGPIIVNRPATTTITTINNNNTTTVSVRPAPPRGGRGPVIVNNGPRGGRGPIIVTARPRVMPGLVGGTTIMTSGFVPAVAAAPADPAVVEVPVPVYTPQPAALAAADPVAAVDPVASTTPTATLRLAERQLRITNNTGERLTVYVQHLSRTPSGEWAWVPADPRAETTAEEFQVEPGADAVLATPAGVLTAQTVRLWAVSESGREWADYKTADLPLVPETDAAGNHSYGAAAVGTFTMNFDR